MSARTPGRRIGHIAGALLCALAVASGCGPGTGSQKNTPESGDSAVKDILSRYVKDFLRRNPTTNTYLGGAGLDQSLAVVDGRLRNVSPAALAEEDKWLAVTARELNAVSADSLTDRVRIDRDVAIAQIRFQLRQHQIRHQQERAVDTYVGEPFRALDWQLQGLAKTGETSYGTADAWRLVIERTRAIPAYLDAARLQLEAGVGSGRVADRRMLERDGLLTSAANAKYFLETLPAIAAERIANGPEREQLLIDLRAAGQGASAAYLRFRDFIAATFFEPGSRNVKAAYAGDRFALGEDEYNWSLTNNFRLDVTVDTLFTDAEPIIERTRSAMIALARDIARERRWPVPAEGSAAVRAVFDQLSQDYPKNDTEMVGWYREAALRLVEFARKTQLFDVPANYALDVVETPPPLQSSIDGASYYPAPPFKGTGIGRFYVTPTHNDVAALQANNRAAIADLSAHEGFPGHDWYFKLLTEARDAVSPVRWLTPGAVEDSSAMWEDSLPAEGWGLYAEALMAEPQAGAPHGFYTPEEHLYQLQGQLYRDLRVRIDTGLHTSRITYDDATTMFSEVVDFLPGSCDAQGRSGSDTKRASCEAAERAIFRYSKWPTQAITYRIGKDQIIALRDETSKALGSRFSLNAFHLAFIRQGTIPSGYFKDTLLRELGAKAPETVLSGPLAR